MSDEVAVAEPVLWKTALAVVVALVVTAIASSVIAIVSSFVSEVFSDMSDAFATFWGQAAGGFLGVALARVACDKLLLPYSRHVVFTIMVVVSVAVFILLWQRQSHRRAVFGEYRQPRNNRYRSLLLLLAG